MAGAIAKQFLSEIKINAYTSAVGNIKLDKSYNDLDLNAIDSNVVKDAQSRYRRSNDKLYFKKRSKSLEILLVV